jgi:hypothetical protein
MSEFKEVLYESLLFGFGKVLASYNVFAQDLILNELGKEIIEYLDRNGYKIDQTGSLDKDVKSLMDLFISNGFSDVEVSQCEHGENYKWSNLYGIKAYSELQEITENPFISCPLNACITYISSKYGKKLVLLEKSFDLKSGIANSVEELVDIDAPLETEKGFNSLVIENRRLLAIAEEKNKKLENALTEIKTLQKMLPICAKCKKIRDEKGYWNQIESYIEQHSETKFSHSLCEGCADELYGDEDWYKDK